MTKPTARIALSVATRPDCRGTDLPTYRGAQIALADLRKRNDLPFEIDVLLLDDQSNEAQAARLAEQAVADDSVFAVVGPMGSNEAFANVPIFAEAGLLQISPCASHPDLCKRGYATFHRLVPNETIQGSELAGMVTDFFGARQVAIVGDSDAFASTVIENFSAGFHGTDTRVVTVARFRRGADDFSEVVASTAASDPDLVFFAVHAHEGKQVSASLRATGLRMPFLGTDGLKTAFFLGGGDKDGDAYHTHSGADFRRLQSAAGFRAAYAARYPEDSTYSPETYDAVMLAAAAIGTSGSLDRAAVLAAFSSVLPYNGITGTISFDDSGERRDAPVSFYQVEIEDGRRLMHYLGTTKELRASRTATTVGRQGRG